MITFAQLAKRKQSRERKQRERLAKRKLGLIPVTCWVKPEQRAELRALEKRLNNE